MMYKYFPDHQARTRSTDTTQPHILQDDVRTGSIFHLKHTLDRIWLTNIYMPNAFKHLCTTLLMIWTNVTISEYDYISHHMYPIICTLYSRPHRENGYKTQPSHDDYNAYHRIWQWRQVRHTTSENMTKMGKVDDFLRLHYPNRICKCHRQNVSSLVQAP